MSDWKEEEEEEDEMLHVAYQTFCHGFHFTR